MATFSEGLRSLREGASELGGALKRKDAAISLRESGIGDEAKRKVLAKAVKRGEINEADALKLLEQGSSPNQIIGGLIRQWTETNDPAEKQALAAKIQQIKKIIGNVGKQMGSKETQADFILGLRKKQAADTLTGPEKKTLLLFEAGGGKIGGETLAGFTTFGEKVLGLDDTPPPPAAAPPPRTGGTTGAGGGLQEVRDRRKR